MTRLFLCEDAKDIRQLLTYQLADHGIEVVAEASSCDGCETIVVAADAEVILLDLSIADGDMTVIRRLAHHAPVVVFSGFPASYKRAECLAAGASAYVEKRAKAPELAAVIDAVRRV